MSRPGLAWEASRSEKANCQSAQLPRMYRTAQVVPEARYQVLSTAVRRWRAESLRPLPFVNVRDVHVQHLPGHMTGLDPLLRDFWVRGISSDKNHAGDEEKDFTFQALV